MGNCYNQDSFLVLQYKIAQKNLPQYPLLSKPGKVYVTAMFCIFP